MEDNKALRYNDWKPQWSLVHFESLELMVHVLEYGAKKYEEKNWMKPMDKSQILDSLTRHLAKLIDWEENDQESNMKHIWHIMANALFYSYHANLWNSHKTN